MFTTNNQKTNVFILSLFTLMIAACFQTTQAQPISITYEPSGVSGYDTPIVSAGNVDNQGPWLTLTFTVPYDTLFELGDYEIGNTFFNPDGNVSVTWSHDQAGQTVTYTMTRTDSVAQSGYGQVMKVIGHGESVEIFDKTRPEMQIETSVIAFPNPFQDQLELRGEWERGTIFTPDGRLVASFGENEQPNLANLPAGILFLRIETESGLETIRLIHE